MCLFYNYHSHCAHPTAVPQTTISASATLFSACQISLCVERPLYLKHCRTSETTGSLRSFVLISSLSMFLTLAFLLLSFVRDDTCSLSSFCSFFFLSSLPWFLYVCPQPSLCLACFHTPFSMQAPEYPHCGELCSEDCFIWLWKLCVNISCLYPLGGVMAAITHCCSTKTDISLYLSLC